MALPTPSASQPSSDPARWPTEAGLERLVEMALPRFLLEQRWYGAKDAGTPSVGLERLVPLPGVPHPATLAVWTVEPPGRAPMRVLVPLALLPKGTLPDDHPAILSKSHPADGLLVDGFASDAVVQALVRLMAGAGEATAEGLRPGHTQAMADAGIGPASHVRRGTAEQSNTSLRIGEGAILKVFRKLEQGTHPELEMGRFLTEEARFPNIPPLLGWLDLAPEADAGGRAATLGVLQGFVPNQGDGWSWVLGRLEKGEDTLAWLSTLGTRTAEMHRALAKDTEDPDFFPEAVDAEDMEGWAEAARAMARQALEGLEWGAKDLSGQGRALAERLQSRQAELMARLDSLLPAAASVAKTRHHGDYHLGQVLVSGDDAVIVDFEGEPLRPLSARRAKHSPLRDVAGMLRSFAYAAAVAARGKGDPALESRLGQWAGEASQAFLQAYLKASEGCPGCAADAADTVRLVRFFMLEKALYEVAYELANRPDWVDIPLAGVLAILDEQEPGIAAKPQAPPADARAHAMPFGAELQADGQVRFRLWAPAHGAIKLELEGRPEPLEMQAGEGGWHELVTSEAGAGSRYRFVLPDGMKVPDPASRHQPQDVHGPSEVVDPGAYRWKTVGWKGRPWEEAVVYELHVGAFTPEGTFRAAISKLDHLKSLGVTVVQVMPVADFPGTRNWGYDGVMPYAPDSAYGRPEDFKAFVDAAHARGLMVMLDVVYNHFGPEGNYLPLYAPQIFTDKHKTPWGAAVNFDDKGGEVVREFIIHNAVYWIEEFNLDGLRLDAVHAIQDDSAKHLLDELAERARALAGDRPVHLVLENEENQAARLGRDGHGKPVHYTAQWNDDVHHGLHVAASGESAGYYGEYAGKVGMLARALAEGFAFQGEVMEYRGHARGEPSAHLPPGAFVAFLQNHDQVGNRAFGDRITEKNPAEAVRAVASLYLLSPQVPMLFMGEEWGASTPFPFFADFGPDLADAVREGRRKEFARFPEFQDPAARERIPDPTADSTFASAKLRWDEREREPHAGWLDWYRRALAVRRERLVPLLAGIGGGAGSHEVVGTSGIVVRWDLGGGKTLAVAANLSAEPAAGFPEAAGEVLWAEGEAGADGRLGPWAVRWTLGDGGPGGGTKKAQETALDRLAARAGIEASYDNARGEPVQTSPETQRALLAAMGHDVADEGAAAAALEALERRDWGRPLPPVAVIRRGVEPTVALTLPAASGEVSWRVELEDGGERSGTAPFPTLALDEAWDLDGQSLERRKLPLPGDLPDGYHRLVILGISTGDTAGGAAARGGEAPNPSPPASPAKAGVHGSFAGQQQGSGQKQWTPAFAGEAQQSHEDEGQRQGKSVATMPLIVSPGRCWLPPSLEHGKRLWGVSAQLYLLRSENDWGIGDFSDLARLAEITGSQGADVIGLNPLHALFPDNPEHASPYSPASRLLLNVLNIDVTALPEFAACDEAQMLARDAEFKQRLAQAREAGLVDYTAVADLKMQALGVLFHACQSSADPARWQAFQAFRQERGEPLERACLFLALRQSFADQGKPDWRQWPEGYRDPDGPDTRAFLRDHGRKVEFMAWLQWLADGQLAAAAQAARDQGMEVGLYRDLAVGADSAGAETWANPKAVVAGASVGAPPDIFNPAGQDWGLPPFNPEALREEGYRSFIELLRANMRHAGGLRIDHVMALQHLYWVPQGASPKDGAYVAYPLDDMVGILALESQRNRCLVVGEDLGTVPPGFREKMADANVLSYRVLYFEQDAEKGPYKAPGEYPALSLATIGSHDMATLRGWWAGSDVDLKASLDQLPGEGEVEKQKALRDRDRACLLAALRAEGLLPADGEPDEEAVSLAAHTFLARSSAGLLVVQVDDLTDEADPVNVPGTSTEHPNWRRRQSLTLEQMAAHPRFAALCRAVAAAREETPHG